MSSKKATTPLPAKAQITSFFTRSTPASAGSGGASGKPTPSAAAPSPPADKACGATPGTSGSAASSASSVTPLNPPQARPVDEGSSNLDPVVAKPAAAASSLAATSTATSASALPLAPVAGASASAGPAATMDEDDDDIPLATLRKRAGIAAAAAPAVVSPSGGAAAAPKTPSSATVAARGAGAGAGASSGAAARPAGAPLSSGSGASASAATAAASSSKAPSRLGAALGSGAGAGARPAAKRARKGSDDEDDGDDDSDASDDGDSDDDEESLQPTSDEDSDDGGGKKGKAKKAAPAARGAGAGAGAGSKKATPAKGKAAGGAGAPLTGAKRKIGAVGAGGKAAGASAGAGSSAAAAAGGEDDADGGFGGGDDDGEGGDGEGGKKAGVLSAGQHKHNSWPWLTSARKDKAGRPPSHPLYNPRTLHVPADFLAKQTPAMAQWWTFKADNMDTLLFMKVGKFYENYHMDSDVAVRELGLIYMKGEVAHSGFPEISYGFFSEKLVALGYRVARVEQTETPQQLKDRNAAAGRGTKDKVVRRALCGIKSKGTRTYGVLDMSSGAAAAAQAAAAAAAEADGAAGAVSSGSAAGANDGSFLYAIVERPLPHDGAAAASAADASTSAHSLLPVHIGVAVTDCATGSVSLAEFADDRHRSRLRTLMARFPPAEFLYEKSVPAASTPGSALPLVGAAVASPGAGAGAAAGTAAAASASAPGPGLSAFTRRMLRADAPAAPHTVLLPGEEFWGAAATAEDLSLSAFGVKLDFYSYSGSGANSSAASGGAGAVPASSPSSAGKAGAAGGKDVTTAGLSAEEKASRLRQRDYYVEDGEPGEDSAAAAAAGAGTAARRSAPPNTATLMGADGKARHVPLALLHCLQRAAGDKFAPSVPADAVAALAGDAADGSLRASGGADLPLSSLSLSAFGATISYLRRCLIDHSILSLRRVARYLHADGSTLASDSLALADSGSGGAADDADGAGVGAGARSAGAAASAVLPPRGEGDSGVPHMVLDGTAILNLEVLNNSYDGSAAGTLLGLLDPHATSPFGKRRLRQWLCTPLYRPEDIADRVSAVEELMPLLDGPVSAAKAALKGLPDLERLLARIHTLGSKVAAQDHPDAQAIMYEMETYGKRKIADLLAALKAFRAIAAVRAAFHGGADGSNGELHEGLACPLLRRVLHESFPDLAPQLAFFASAFDAKQAEKDGRIKPAAGVDAAYDAALGAIKDIEGQLAEYLREQKKALRCEALVYWGSAKDRFQIEVPEAVSSRVPDDFTLKSRRKGSGKTGGVVRYWTPETERLLAELVAAEERREAAVKDSLRRIFHRFDAHRVAWQAAVNCAAVLDCLIALATWSARGDGGSMCKPTILPPASTDGEPILHLEEARHPCMVVSQLAASSSVGAGAGAGGDDEGSGIASVGAGAAMVIPNDLFMGRPAAGDASAAGAGVGAGAGAGMAEDGSDGYGATPAPGAPCVLVTGPNMGGKSTLLRQACLSVILAQLGAYVPASRMTLTPVDRVFTRVGASDRILAGQSTFYVELAETSAILHQATTASLVILDELGRGTSTFDGNAIAYAVTRHLVDVVGCRTLFATHYHTLTDDFAVHAGVALGHMGCLVEERADGTSSVTFLYKYQDGACPKSYGLNVARLAHLPESVILRAKAKSEEFEAAVEAAKRGELVLPSSPSGAGAGAGAGSSAGSDGIGADSDADAWAAFYDAADAFSGGGTETAAAALLSTARRLRGLAE